MTIALIDGDIVAYRTAASCSATKEREEVPLAICISRLDELVYRILGETQTEQYRIFISGTENFRKTIYPVYKDNRRHIIPPRYLEECREFLVREWGAEVTAGYEADDGIGIAANEQSIICSIDKDLRQISGQHYNFVTQAHSSVDPYQASLNYWLQVLQGDRADNVSGVRGVGPVKAHKILLDVPEAKMEATVLCRYPSRSEFILNCRLLKVLRSQEEYTGVLRDIESGYYAGIVEEIQSQTSPEADSQENT